MIVSGKLKWYVLLGYLKPYSKLYVFDLVFAVLEALSTLSIPFVIRDLLSIVGEDNGVELSYLLGCSVILLVLVALIYVANFFITKYGCLVGAFIERDMRKDLFEHYEKLSCQFFDKQRIGQLISRITVDLYGFSDFFHHASEELLIAAVKYLIAFTILFQINAKLSLALIVMFPAVMFISLYYIDKMEKASIESHNKIAEINEMVADSLSGIRTVKLFGNEKVEIQKFNFFNHNFVEWKKYMFTQMSKYFGCCFSLMASVMPVVTILGILIINSGDKGLTVPDITMFLLYVGILLDPTDRLLGMAQRFADNVAGYERFLEVLSEEVTLKNSSSPAVKEVLKGDITLEHVDFSYDSNTNLVLSDLSFDVKAGTYVALVGASGAGKTTICNLIARLYDVNKGQVLIDGVNVRDWSLEFLREQICFVQQDPYLFSGSILENIRYGCPEASFDDVVRAAKDANIHDFIQGLPNKYETEVGERGVYLSGGQKQRVAIARGFIRNPSILILDEATSALDNESEYRVQQALERLCHNRTTLVIAHRLSTIKKAQRILVISDGKVVESGKHDELLAEKGIYATYYMLQFDS